MYRVIREHRKSMTIKIEENLEVVLKVPYNVPDKIIEQTYRQHEKWIEEALRRKRLNIEKSNWIENQTIYYFGEPKQIQFIKSQDGYKCVKLVKDTFYIFAPDLQDEVLLKKLLQDYYKQVGKLYLTQRTKEYCKELKCTYNNITLRNQKTRWGSCSAKGNLNYNIRIMCAPKEMIDYIVLHEVMHLIHFDHSKSFWISIARMMPDYKKRQAYFEKCSDLLYV